MTESLALPNASHSALGDPTIEDRMQAFHDRIDALKNAQFPYELVQMIDDFLDDAGWDGEPRRWEYRFNDIVGVTYCVVKHCVLSAVCKGRDGVDQAHGMEAVEDCPHFLYRGRRRLALDDRAVFQGFLAELDERFFTHTREDLGQDCPSFVPEVFDAFTAPEKAEYQALLVFLRKASAVRTAADVAQLRCTL